jgi:hypothetical protein
VKSSLWALTVGAFSTLLAAVLVRFIPLPLPALVVSVALVSTVLSLIAELSPRTGAAGGIAAASMVAIILGLTISAAPLGPGVQRPGLRDLFWKPLLLLALSIGLCALAGYCATRAVALLRRR